MSSTIFCVWLLNPVITHDKTRLPPEVQLKGIQGQYPALSGALDAMTEVVRWIHEYGREEANCPKLDWDTDLEGEELSSPGLEVEEPLPSPVPG